MTASAATAPILRSAPLGDESERAFFVFLSGKEAASLSPPPSSQAGLLPPSPLGTDRESLPSISSSLLNALFKTRFHHFQLLAMHLSMTFWVKQHEVFCRIFASVRSPDDMVAMPLGNLCDLLAANWTEPLLLSI